MKSQIKSLVGDLVEEITREVANKILKEVGLASKQVKSASTKVKQPKEKKQKKTTKSATFKTCYYTGCQNTAAPRFGMFCAALHKDISDTQKAKYKKLHTEGDTAKAPTPQKRKTRGPGKKVSKLVEKRVAAEAQVAPPSNGEIATA